jgi:protease IV
MNSPQEPSAPDSPSVATSATAAPSAAPAASPAATPAGAPTSAVEASLAQFAADYLKDRRSERRWRRVSRVAWLLFMVAVVWLLVLARQGHVAPAGPHTALIEVRGEISVDAEASAENLLPGLKQAFEDPGAQAVVLRMNSPGGSPVQAGLIHDEILRLKALHQKKVYAVVEESCASGAYYIAVAADVIYADKASIVGSIGVLMDGFGVAGAMEKLGIERRLMTAGENKALGDPFSPLSPKHRAHVQAMLDQIHQQFIAVVKEGRGERLKPNADMFSGLYWNGARAMELGLVDDLGSLDYVAREVVRAAEVVDYTPRENITERLAKRFGAAAGQGAISALRSLPSMR